ncbi:magnesium and cobalt transport protein CorA [Amnibacterium kyonggiense]|uniref:Magnesium transporter n=1 Tax=Amnibacterium kyonggiense TaxID=595671 RepID=A0A4R7FT15_9MICO|nr:magnesium and cobalt transport protein CorA [Amnibacterium kyonggiense]TDS81017.1 magnesium transporter [Amnibacterium kyonggiense]
MPIIDNAVYVDGKRTPDPTSLSETYDLVKARQGFGWIGLYRPDPAELQSVADEFSLHPLAVEDALEGHQRPKIERYGGDRFVVLRHARYMDTEERVDFGEVDLFVGRDYVVVVRHAEAPELQAVRARLEAEPKLLAKGPLAVLYAIADRVVDDYSPVVNGLENDIDEIEDQLFAGDSSVSQRIYELTREVITFQRAIAPLAGVLQQLRAEIDGREDLLEVRRGLRDVLDHVTRVQERVEGFRVLLQNALMVNSTLVGQRQNDQIEKLTRDAFEQGNQVKKVSSWAAIGFFPGLLASIWGMNFKNMPELAWPFGYPLALTAMVTLGIVLYVTFRRRNWL